MLAVTAVHYSNLLGLVSVIIIQVFPTEKDFPLFSGLESWFYSTTKDLEDPQLTKEPSSLLLFGWFVCLLLFWGFLGGFVSISVALYVDQPMSGCTCVSVPGLYRRRVSCQVHHSG